jgi:hypothetical protein
MKLIYLTVDGREIVEKAHITQRIIQEPDGYHPVTNDSVWHNTRRRPDTRIVILDGVLPPLGSNMAHEDVVSLFREEITMEAGFEKKPVSKMWMRSFARMGEWFMKYGIMMGFALLGIYLVVSQLFLGGI